MGGSVLSIFILYVKSYSLLEVTSIMIFIYMTFVSAEDSPDSVSHTIENILAVIVLLVELILSLS